MMALTRTIPVIAVATAMLVSPSGRLLSQTAKGAGQPSTAELARNIANTIATFTPKGVQGPMGLKFESAISNGNLVEIRYSVADATAYARLKANSESFKSGKTAYFCNEARVAPIRQGVVIHEVTVVTDGSDKIEVTVDLKTCEGLVRPALADPKTIAQMAETIAKAENELEKSGSNDLFRFEPAAVRDGVVEKRLIVLDAPAFRADGTNINGMLMGYNCGKYREQILRGVVFRYEFIVNDGGPAESLVIGRSKC